MDPSPVGTGDLAPRTRLLAIGSGREVALLDKPLGDRVCFTADGTRVMTYSPMAAQLWDSVPLRVRRAAATGR